MPYEAHNLVTFSGIFGLSSDPIERFSFGLAFDSDDVPTDALALAMFGIGTTFVNDACAPCANLTAAKVARIGVDGLYTSPSKTFNGAPIILAGAMPYPTQVSLAFSLRSNDISPRSKGRFYIPVPQVSLNADTGLMTTESADNMSVLGTEFIGDLESAWAAAGGTPGASVCVASSIDGNHEVTILGVGRALDTIRSRRRDLQENYVYSAV